MAIKQQTIEYHIQKEYKNSEKPYLISGNISIAVFNKNKREKMGRKMKGHKKKQPANKDNWKCCFPNPDKQYLLHFDGGILDYQLNGKPNSDKTFKTLSRLTRADCNW